MQNSKSKHKRIALWAFIAIIVGATLVSVCGYYYIPRNMRFSKVAQIYDNSDFLSSFTGFHYVSNEDELHYWLIEYRIERQMPPCQDIEKCATTMDFERYDYLITYHKPLRKLQYSPYLRKMYDGLYFDPKMPLVAQWGMTTDSIYIYQIYKNSRFRSVGP